MDDIEAAAQTAKVKTEGLYTVPRELDFGSQQRLSFASLLRVGGQVTAELAVHQPSIAGSDAKLIGRVRQLVNDSDVVVFAVPDRSAREHLMGHFSDENIPFEVSLGTSEENIPNWDISDTSYKTA